MHNQDIDKNWLSEDLAMAILTGAESLLESRVKSISLGGKPTYAETTSHIAHNWAAKVTELRQYTAVQPT